MKIKGIVYLCLLVVVMSLFLWWVFYNQAVSRDYQRLTDLKIIQSELTQYYRQFNTYKIPECQNDSLINFCIGTGKRVLPFADIIDPINTGNYQYSVELLRENDYIIRFAFERGVAKIAPGNYILTKEGIGK